MFPILHRQPKLAELKTKSLFYILDLKERETFVITQKDCLEKGRKCQKGTIIKEETGGMTYRHGTIFNDELAYRPKRYEFTQQFEDALGHCSKQNNQ